MSIALYVFFSISLCFISDLHGTSEVQNSTPNSLLNPFALEVYNECLKKFNSVEARFIQDNGKQRIKGKLYLQKPGKLRIIYDANLSGQRREILCDGSYLTEYLFDSQGELEESSSVDLAETPLQIVLNTQGIDLRHVKVQRIFSAKKNQEVFTYITLVKKEDTEDGKVMLVFKENKTTGPQFCGWIIHDENHREISLELTHVNNNVIILPKTFSTSSEP
ncbi:LolA family protein [Holospora curviuscula]|nr:outer-membrane lipoprotein carrier protein LolA [Holospora curviuscula]